ncbi:hypothetical protein L6164_017225 [Bauhinia variegata]|uniref:Uncharacterized protein n=1 Tax=Bauhinia variegata TaxID=167791 RepID=A0ACB9N7F9_BAUVA|nr:hypothetical protein L6164_017225 [Bauhinia variegata]
MEHGTGSFSLRSLEEIEETMVITVENLTIGDRKISALVVDDDTCTRLIHKRMLEKFNMEVKAVANGKAAVDLYQAGAYFDVIFMDHEMPVMDGAEATKELRGMGVKSLIVGVTSLAGVSERNRFMDSGLDQCFEKPLTHEMVEVMLRKLKKESN